MRQVPLRALSPAQLLALVDHGLVDMSDAAIYDLEAAAKEELDQIREKNKLGALLSP